jgi:hypothetical protein
MYIYIGMNDNNIGLDSQSPITMWAVWDSPQDVLLTPSQAHIKPFKTIHVNWIIQIHFKFHGNEKLIDVYQQILKYIRPGDFIIFVVSADHRLSQGIFTYKQSHIHKYTYKYTFTYLCT